MRLRWMLCAAVITLGEACSGGPRPGSPGYPYNVSGIYGGRVVVEGEIFDARLELRTLRGGSVRGTFRVGAPFDLEGRASGAVVDDLLRLTLAYETGDGVRCDGRIEGILSVAPGGAVIDGPVTLTDCEGALAGRMSFRR